VNPACPNCREPLESKPRRPPDGPHTLGATVAIRDAGQEWRFGSIIATHPTRVSNVVGGNR